MAFEFRFPDVGEGITEGEIIKWLVNVGDKIKIDQPLVEVETDKAVVEIPSPVAGTIIKMSKNAGNTINVGDIMVVIEEEGEVSKENIQAVSEPEQVKQKSVSVVGELEEAPDEEDGKAEIIAIPAVKKFAKELGVDLTKVKGTGIDGRITKEDVEKASAYKEITKKTEGEIEKVPFKGLRRLIAKQMITSASKIPSVTIFDEADVTLLFEIKAKMKETTVKKGIYLTYIPFIIKAVIYGLKKFPALNSSLDEENEVIILKKFYNIGIATDTEEGLIVPVIKDADKKSFSELADLLARLTELAKSRKIELKDLKGSTFSITNYGAIGGIFGTPIINYPECAILGVGKVIDKPVVMDGEIKIRKILPLSLSFDHRIVDGAYAQRFLNSVTSQLEGEVFAES